LDTVQIGTPAQSVYAQLDTGSWELWVNPSCSGLSSSADKTFCTAVGQYKPDDSSSSDDTGETKTLNYGVGSAEIEYFTDDIALSDSAKLKSVQFGVASRTTDQFAGVLGIGYGKGVNTKYDNFIDELAGQGVTDTRAFSVALGSKTEGGGVIAFGGVDRKKFSGRLASLPIISAGDAPDGVARYWVQLDSVSLTPPSGQGKKWDGTSMAVFLDTGATLTLLPPSVVKAIAADFGSDGQDDAGFYGVDCDLVNKAGTVDFAFDGVTVKVPYKEIIREFGGSNPSCYLGIAPSEDYALLGDTFLRSAYAVFDLDSDTVFLAQYENCGSDVSSIKSSSNLGGLQGSCGGSSNSDKEEEVVEEDEKTDNSSSQSSTSAAEKTSTTTEAATETSSEAATTTTTSSEDSLPVVTEVASTSSRDASTTESTTLSTASKPSETESSNSAGPDSATETGSTPGSSTDSSSNGGDAEGAAGRVKPFFELKSLFAISVGATVMMML
jgi:hypothetical protein